jgi:methylene-tetrahydromethanopterin dehydrogenase
MQYRNILHMLSPQKHVSPFDVNMALDNGYHAVVPYARVELSEVTSLVRDAIFSRGVRGAKRTAVFIGGKDAVLSLEMLDAARRAMVRPFEFSVLVDPGGAFTAAAALAVRIEEELKARSKVGWRGLRVRIFGGTGVVGFATAAILAGEGAEATLIGYDGPNRVRQLADAAKRRFGVDVHHADGSTDTLREGLLEDAEIVICAARAGTEVLNASHLRRAGALKVAADVNAVPPAGIAGIGMNDDGSPLAGTSGVAIGPLTIGRLKNDVQAGLFRNMSESERPFYLDLPAAFRLAREIVG